MYCVYIIESEKNKKWYIGSTKNIQQRLTEHNQGKTRSTKAYIPYKLIYNESYQTKTEALRREKQIKKSGVIRKEIKRRLLTAPSSSG